MTSEHTLLERVKKHDIAALGELYDRYAPRIYAYIYRRVGDVHLAEDLTGGVFERVIRAVRAERFWHTSFRAWIFRIAHNMVADHYRGRQGADEVEIDEQVASGEDDPVVAVAERLAHERVLAAIGRLTPDQQQVLALRFGEGMSARETAEVMGKSTGAAEALQHRALAALRRALDEE